MLWFDCLIIPHLFRLHWVFIINLWLILILLFFVFSFHSRRSRVATILPSLFGVYNILCITLFVVKWTDYYYYFFFNLSAHKSSHPTKCLALEPTGPLTSLSMAVHPIFWTRSYCLIFFSPSKAQQLLKTKYSRWIPLEQLRQKVIKVQSLAAFPAEAGSHSLMQVDLNCILSYWN